jgi:hypothetical protein
MHHFRHSTYLTLTTLVAMDVRQGSNEDSDWNAELKELDFITPEEEKGRCTFEWRMTRRLSKEEAGVNE